jgi:hypothetical protein
MRTGAHTVQNASIRLLSLSALAGALCVSQVASSEPGLTVIVPGEMRWEQARAMPEGMRIMLLSGAPSQPGAYIYRIRMPSGYKVPPVKYPDDRITTILEGVLSMGVGMRFDPTEMKEVGPGAFFVTRAGTPHYQWARTEVMLQVMGYGPIEDPVTYLDPSDDPRGQR